MTLKLNISTCPNDTFMFDALLHGRVDTEGLEFDLHLADIEELNALAIASVPDVTKLSYATYPLIKDNYLILNSGSALGRGNGPLLVSKRVISKSDLAGATVAIPGKYTTANLLLTKFFPEIAVKKEYLFSDIAPAVLSGEVDAGVLIHEGRFTYADAGLHLVADLGVEWESHIALPLPLGAIVASRALPDEIIAKTDRALRRSIEYAFANRSASYPFIKQYAQELDDNVIAQHINLFVNQFSIDLTETGRSAVKELVGFDCDFL